MIDEIKVEDLENLTIADARTCYLQKEFHVRGRKFKNDGEGTFYSGEVKVFHDQQDSTSWMAQCGKLRTGFYWSPQDAVASLFRSVRKVGPVGDE